MIIIIVVITTAYNQNNANNSPYSKRAGSCVRFGIARPDGIVRKDCEYMAASKEIHVNVILTEEGIQCETY